jgi:hypothetical protein
LALDDHIIDNIITLQRIDYFDNIIKPSPYHIAYASLPATLEAGSSQNK